MAARAGLAALVLMLAACTGEVRETPPPLEVALTLPGAERPLPAEHWPAEGPARAVILGLHGFGDRGGTTFVRAGPWWAAQGIEVWAYDQRGFGRNPDRMDWQGDDAMVADLAAVAAQLRVRYPGLPLFVIGHSMGGGVVLTAAGEGRLPGVAGIVLLAPAVWGGESLPLQYRLSAWTAAQLVPDLRWTGRGVVTIRPTDNIEALRALAADPWHFATPSSREFLGLVRLMDRALAAAPGVEAPTLIVWGVRDEVVPEAPVLAARDRIAGVDYARVPTGWHMLLRDLRAEAVYRLVLDWMESHGR
jgi:acylglycerol lipase